MRTVVVDTPLDMRTGIVREDALTVGRAGQRWMIGLSLLVAALAIVATIAGIFTFFGQRHLTFISLRGEPILIQGGGLYAYESVSGAAQAVGQDIVTLLVAVPLLLTATVLAARGSTRGVVVRAGALWYFTYTYLLMAFGGAYNPLFLVYVALYSASLFAFILSLLAIDPARLHAQLGAHFARRAIGWLVIVIGSMLTLLWLGRIVPALINGTVPAGLESYSTLFVQAGDLGLVIPLATLTGALLLKRRPLGDLLAAVVLVKSATLGLALIAMTVMMAAAGVAVSPVEVGFFSAIAVSAIVGVVHLLSRLPGRAMRAQN